MDSKTKKLAISAGLGIILLVAITVLIMNYQAIFGGNTQETVQGQDTKVQNVDENGMAHKPFLLPQKNPKEFYDSQMYAYNIPEFVNGKVQITGSEIASFARDTEGVKLGFRKK